MTYYKPQPGDRVLITMQCESTIHHNVRPPIVGREVTVDQFNPIMKEPGM